MSNGKSVVSSVVIHLASDLASEFFRESGDLPVGGFPATTELANIVGKLLGLDHAESAKVTLETFVRTRKTRKRLS